MNIVFYRYNSICEHDYIAAFNMLGITVVEFRHTEAEFNQLVAEFGRLVLENHPVFVFSINFFPFISIVCEKLNIKYVCVSVDCPVMEIYNSAIRNSCNRVFLFDREQYLTIRDENPDRIFHLPLGAAVERIDDTIGEFDKCFSDYKYDVSFVGSLYNEKDPYPELDLPQYEKGYLDGLISVQELFPGLELIENSLTDETVQALKHTDPSFYPSDMSVFNIDCFVAVNNYLSYHLTYLDRVMMISTVAGYTNANGIHFFTLSDTSVLSGNAQNYKLMIHGGVDSLKEMPRVFRQSKININHTMRSIKTGLPQRIWDVMGSGGFLLTNSQSEIPDYLNPGEHLETYDSLDELVEKINYYLAHEDERREIAFAGYTEVKNRHTVLHRVMEMIKKIQ
ncbi:spore maturation protein CgeB [Lachnospiraceae bacterium XBB2008]|nr:spore maturation protein CgeB [Lachnospiraceae bacterium XBB2008]